MTRLTDGPKHRKTAGKTARRAAGFTLCLLLAAWCAVLCAACGRQQADADGDVYLIYYVNNEETKTASREYVTRTEDTALLIEELLGQLAEVPSKFEYEAPLAGNFALLGYTVDNGQLVMNFDTAYREMDSVKEVLTRAAVVRTLTQIPGVDYVSFTVQGEVLTDGGGMAVGAMSADSFIENAGSEINSYEKVNLLLYFADEDGGALVEENRSDVVYSSNISLEKLVVEKLVAGPVSENAYPVVDPSTQILGVNVKDGICYVNFDETFLNQIYDTSAEVTIYAITNSLVELPNINKVQITVNGDTNYSYREKISLNEVFERNLDLLAAPEEE